MTAKILPFRRPLGPAPPHIEQEPPDEFLRLLRRDEYLRAMFEAPPKPSA